MIQIDNRFALTYSYLFDSHHQLAEALPHVKIHPVFALRESAGDPISLFHEGRIWARIDQWASKTWSTH